MRKLSVILQVIISLFLWTAVSYSHLCDNVFRQADKLIIKPETYNIVVKDQATFKIFLQNNMDRGIAEISLIAESPVFNFTVTPAKMSIPKDQRTYFTVNMVPRAGVKTGNYPINFRLVGGGAARSKALKIFLERTSGRAISVLDNPQFVVAFGAALS